MGEVTPREVERHAWEHPAVAQLDVKPGRPHSAPMVFKPYTAEFLVEFPFLPHCSCQPSSKGIPQFLQFVDKQGSETKLDAEVCACKGMGLLWPSP